MTDRAVVLGAGVAGLAAAAALRRHFDQVLVLERDTDLDDRRGVAQASQLHNVLRRAQVSLERLLPGFAEALIAEGAVAARVASQTHVWELGVRMPLRDLGFPVVSATRPAVERAAAARLPAGVEVRCGTTVDGLVAEAGRVVGVTTAVGDVRADLVVDATGVSTRVPAWSSRAGLVAPPVEETPVRRWYVTLEVERPAALVGRPDLWLAFGTPPASAGLLVSPLDDRRWRVSASGGPDLVPPRDLAGFQRHAVAVHEELRGLLDDAVPLARPVLFRKQVVRRVRYDLLAEPAEGLWAVGDAVASLDPLLGQGMSVAAWQAEVLLDGLPTDAREHHRRAAGPVDTALGLARLLDDAVLDGDGRQVDGLRHFASLARAVVQDGDLHDSYVRMWHLLHPADELRRPSVVDRVRVLTGGATDETGSGR